MVGCKIHTGRSFVILRIPECFRSHCHVLLLHARRNRTSNATISLVEKVFNTPSNGSICCCYGARISTSLLQSMQLSNCFRLVDWNARLHVLLFVQELLQWSLSEGELSLLILEFSIIKLNWIFYYFSWNHK